VNGRSLPDDYGGSAGRDISCERPDRDYDRQAIKSHSCCQTVTKRSPDYLTILPPRAATNEPKSVLASFYDAHLWGIIKSRALG
jgi:hypothetical protein